MLKRRVLGATMIVAMLAVTSGQVMAASKKVPTSGSVELTNAEVTPFTVTSAGGGTWNYGSEVTGAQKHGWSYYTHPSLYHSATAIVGTDTQKQYATAGYWAYADAYGPWYETAYAYWATY